MVKYDPNPPSASNQSAAKQEANILAVFFLIIFVRLLSEELRDWDEDDDNHFGNCSSSLSRIS